MNHYQRSRAGAVQKAAALLLALIMGVMIINVQAVPAYAEDDYNGTDSVYNDPETYVVYTKIDDYFYRFVNMLQKTDDTAGAIKKEDIKEYNPDVEHSWEVYPWRSAAGFKEFGLYGFEKYNVGTRLEFPIKSDYYGGNTSLQIRAASVSSCHDFIREVYGETFAEDDDSWLDYYIQHNFVNYNSFASFDWKVPPKDLSVSEMTVRGIRYYYFCREYFDVADHSYSSMSEFVGRPWNWIDAVCVIGDYFYEFEFSYTPGCYEFTDAAAAMKILADYTFYPGYDNDNMKWEDEQYPAEQVSESETEPSETENGPEMETDQEEGPDIYRIYPASGKYVSDLIDQYWSGINITFTEPVTEMDFSKGNISLCDALTGEEVFSWDLASMDENDRSKYCYFNRRYFYWKFPENALDNGFQAGRTYYLKVDPGVLMFEEDTLSLGYADSKEWTVSMTKRRKEEEQPALQDIKGEFLFSSTRDFDQSMLREGRMSFVYNPGWFMNSSVENYDSHLARLSMNMALAASADLSDRTDRYAGYYIEEFMKKLNFKDIEVNEDYSRQLENDSIGVAIGSSRLDKDTVLLAVALRGGNYGNEWGGNFEVGRTGDHEGFSKAADKVVKAISGYINENSITGNIKIWMTGYSRASAVCNLAAASLDRDIAGSTGTAVFSSPAGSAFLKQEDLFAYCFEVPACTTDPEASSEQYYNIYSVVNPTDPVPRMPLEQWGFTRYGWVLFIPYPGQKNYDKYVDQMKEHFSDIYAADLKNMPDITQMTGLNMLMNELYTSVPSRAIYNELIEDAMIEAAQGLLGASKKPFVSDLDTAWVTLILLPTLGAQEIVKSKVPSYIKYLQPKARNSVPSLAPSIAAGTLSLPHYLEYTMAWMVVLEGTGVMEAGMERSSLKENTSYYRLMVKINCPVNVFVMNEDGKGEASYIWYSDVGQGYFGFQEGGEVKACIADDGGLLFALPKDRQFNIKIVGYDEGSMQISVIQENVMTGEANRVTHYYDMSIEIDKSYSMNLFTGTETGANPEYDVQLWNPREEEIAWDYDSAETGISLVELGVEISGNGMVSGSGNYVKGSVTALLASAFEGEEFLGWFSEDGTYVSQEESLPLHLNRDQLYKARFTENTDLFDADADNEATENPAEITGEIQQTEQDTAEGEEETGTEDAAKETTVWQNKHSQYESVNTGKDKKGSSSVLLIILGVAGIAGTALAVVLILRKKKK